MATSDNDHLRAVDHDEELTDEDLQDLHEDILDRNEDGVRSLLNEFLEQDLPIKTLCCTEVELEPATHDHILNWLPLSGLHRAALINSHGILDAILSSVPGIDINLALKKSGYSALHVAASAGVLAAVNYLTSSGACVKARDAEGNAPMHVAAQNGHKDVVSLLCVRGAGVNIHNNQGETPLHMATEAGHQDVTDFLLGKDADINARDKSGLTPLHAAQVKGHVAITERLLDKGAGIHTCDKSGNSPIHTWILKMKEKGKGSNFPSETSLAVLLNRNGDVNLPNYNGDTPLHLAAAAGHGNTSEFLINQGADVNKVNYAGRSAIFASKSGEVTDILVKSGAVLSLCDNRNNCVLHTYASCDDVTLSMMKIVIDKNVAINVQNVDGQTPLYCACACGNKTKTELLLSCGAQNDIVDNNGRSILHISLTCIDGKLPMWLLDKNNINITHQDQDGNTLLHLAAECGNTTVVNYLVSRNVDVSTKNAAGHTAATLAAKRDNIQSARTILLRGGAIDPDGGARILLTYVQRNDTEVVSKLLEQVDCNKALSGEGQSALHLAIDVGTIDMSTILLDHGANICHLDNTGQSPLHVVCRSLPHLESLVSRLIAPEVCEAMDSAGNTPLHHGIAYCSENTLALFLTNGYNPSLQDASGKTVAHLLIESIVTNKPSDIDSSLLSKLELLLAKCTQCVNQCDKNNESLLHVAVKSKQLSVVSILLKNQADVNALNIIQTCPLHYACGDGQAKIASLLLCHQANPNIQDHRGRSPIFEAIISENLELVQSLLHKGADVDVQDSQGKTCLMVGMESTLSELCFEVISESTPDMSLRDIHNSTLLHYAARYCTRVVVDLLLDQGAEVNVLDVHLGSPLHASVVKIDQGVIATLLDAGANIDAQDDRGSSALHVCSEQGSYNHTKLLIDYGADVEIRDHLGRAATHLAAMARDSDVIELLIANEADIDVTDSEGNTPLALSIMQDNIENSSDLLDQNADVSIQNLTGDTALHHAMRMPSLERQLLKLMVHRGKCCLQATNNAGQTPIDVLFGRTDIDPGVVALDIGLEL